MEGLAGCTSCAWPAWHIPTRRAANTSGRYCLHRTFWIVVRPNDVKTGQITPTPATRPICARLPIELMLARACQCCRNPGCHLPEDAVYPIAFVGRL